MSNDKKVIFIGGLGGTGKSSLVYYFLENPINGYTFFDFDKGKYPFPKGESSHFERREKQTTWRLKVAEREYESRGNISVIMGLSLYPKNIYELNKSKKYGFDNIYHAYLYCDPIVRKERLFKRGTPDHRKENNPWHDEYHKVLEDAGAVRFDTTDKKISYTAIDIKKWFIQLLQKL